MSRRLVPLTRLLGLSVLCLGFALGCGDSSPPTPQPPKPLPDAALSLVEVDRATQMANGVDAVSITITVKQKDGSPIEGRTVNVEVSGEGNTVTQPVGRTDVQGRATASVVSTRAGAKTVTASVEADGGAVVLAMRPVIDFTAHRPSRLAFSATALSASAGAPMAGLVVELRDAAGRTVVSATDEVTLSLAAGPGDASLEGTLTVQAVDGVARFSEVVLKKAGTGYQLKVEASGLEGATSPTFAVAPGAAVSLALSGLLEVTAAGVVQGAQVTALDVFGNVATGYTGTVAVTSSDATADLPAAHTFSAADAGRFTFVGLALKRAGSQRVTFQDGASAALTVTQDVGVVAASASVLAFTSVPARASVRSRLDTVTVVLEDAHGNRAAVGAPAVTMGLVQGDGELVGVREVAPVDGVVSFTNLRVNVEGSVQLRASASGFPPATSAAIAIVDDVPPAQPTLVAGASTASTATVTWLAVGDDGTEGTATSQELRYSASPITSDAEFDAATPEAVGSPAPAGTPESATLTQLAPSQSYYVALRVTDDRGQSARSASLEVQTRNADVTQVVFSTQPANGNAGAVLPDVRVSLLDVNGNVVTTTNTPVTLTLVGSQDFEPVTIPSASGVATFTGLRVEEAGTHRFAATANGLPPVESDPFTIAPGAAVRLALTGLVAPVVAGVAGSLVVTAYDTFDNVATGYTGRVHFTSNDAEADLPDDYTFIPGDEGRHVFDNVVLYTAGERRVTVTDTAVAGFTDSLDVDVASDTAERLELTGLAANVTAGAENRLTVSARDRYGNLVTAYSGRVRFTSSDAQAVLPEDYTFVPAQDGGQHEFPVTLRTAGAAARTVTVTEQGGAGLTDTESTVVAPAAASRMTLALSATTPAAGEPVSATVTLLDASGNRASGYRGTVSFRIPDDAQATVPSDYVFTETDAGQHLFSVTFAAAKNSELIVQEVAGQGLQAREAVVVRTGVLGALRVARVPGPVVAGQALGFVVTAHDGFGNRKADYRGAVATTTTDANPGPLESHTYTEQDNGEYTFRATLRTAGTQTVTFTDNALGVSGSDDVTVEAAEATQLVFITEPGTGTVGQPIPRTQLELRDAFGNTPRVAMPRVTLSLQGGSGGATLGGTTALEPVNGVYVFTDVTVSAEGSYLLIATPEDPRIPSVDTSLTISDVTAPAAAALSASLVDNTTVRLTWQATGDDGTQGRATSYQLRFSSGLIDESNFDSADPVPTDPPQTPGSSEVVTWRLPDAQATWYFALRVVDNVGNRSTLSVTSIDLPGPCGGVICPPRAPECGADNRSLVTYAAACVVQNGTGVCEYTPTLMACAGQDAVCFEGACDTAAPPAAGELVISEVMHSPSAGTTEYIELTNTTDRLLNVTNLLVSYDNGAGGLESFAVQAPGDEPRVVAAGGTFVVANDVVEATNGGVPADYSFAGGTFVLGNTGRLTLDMGATRVDDVSYTATFPQATGRAMNLSSVVVGTSASRHAWYWCDSSEVLAGGDRGTPGRANETCAVAINPPVDYCVIQFPQTIPAPIEVNTPQTVYSRFFDDQVTHRNQSGNDNFPFVVAELGYGTDPGAPESWTWTPAAFNAGYAAPGGSNDDETMGTLNIATAGSYFYGFRYRFTRGPAGAESWVYCDQQGVVGPGNPADYGTVTVNPPPPTPLTNHVVISEISGNGPGGTSDDFIELHNPTNADVNIGEWRVQYKAATSATYTNSLIIPAGTIIRARGYFLIGRNVYSGSPAADLTSNVIDMSSSTTTGGHIRIGPGLTSNASDVPVDRLGWGTGNDPEGTAGPFHPAAGGSLERKAVSSSTSTTMAVGGTDAARGNGYDSDNNSQDFVVRAVRQPQSSASPTELP
ncbi:lamin tail domain-containing protein [Pyxidicoccus sp. 3LG]